MVTLGETLGTGTYTASVFTRNGRQRLLTLDGISGGGWTRTRNAYSEGTVTIDRRSSDGTNVSCWDDLGEVHTWAHTLRLYRSGDEVWEGPITRVNLGTQQVTLYARDVLGWMTKRRVRLRRVFGKHDPDQPALDEAALTINRAFNPDDPNVTSHMVVIPDATADKPMVDRGLHVNDGYYYDDLLALVDQGINFTTVGRAILLWTDNKNTGRTPMLIPERDLTGDVLLTEDGMALATKMTAANGKKDATVIAHGLVAVDGVSDFYGLHDMLTDPHGRKKVPKLRAVARRAMRHAYPAPVSLYVPAGATVNPAAPLPVEMLVPGVIVPVESKNLPGRMSARFVLDKVETTFSATGETVAVTLVPPAGPADTSVDSG